MGRVCGLGARRFGLRFRSGSKRMVEFEGLSEMGRGVGEDGRLWVRREELDKTGRFGQNESVWI
jgi:hypothetical protein